MALIDRLGADRAVHLRGGLADQAVHLRAGGESLQWQCAPDAPGLADLQISVALTGGLDFSECEDC